DAVNGLSVYNAVAQLDGGNKASCLTNSLLNGDFIMYDVTGGTHTFQTWGYAYRFLQQEITATEGNNLNLGDILLTPDPNTFNGRALDAGTRLPISGATVILTGNGQNISTTSFPDGRFVLLNVPQGNYDITVEAPAHSLAHLKAAHPGNNINAEIGDVLLP
ncbi:MAG TPA: carboxypeptidase-like regulatory domain-containing protein, partial [Candidatus Sumerlaeia bacterium]|nr:carboxypeptidase-like regulatory domain-containing protein [Candidatus Sumerlaeia bacterium]